MCRRQRQLQGLLDLCRSGGVARAVDLAFDHFTEFGCDRDVVDLLSETIERTAPSEDVRRRFEELRAAHH